MIRRSLLLAVAALALAAHAPAAIADVDTDWQDGRAAFATGDYGTALNYFERARDGGASGPAVHYNIATCHFKLGNYDAALSTYQFIAGRYPQIEGLALYNAGLAERRLGNHRAAQRLFISAWHHSEDAKVRALAAAQLADAERAPARSWEALFSLGAGHDDNVALRDSLGLPAGVSAASPLVDLFGMLQLPLGETAPLTFEGSLYAITYPDADEFDQAEIRVGLDYAVERDRWRLSTGLDAVTGTLGGSRFNEELNADIGLTWYLGSRTSLDLRGRYDEVRGADVAFRGIDGARSRLDLRYRWRQVPHYVVIRAGLEDNRRRDAAVSPTRSRFEAAYYLQVNGALELMTTAGVRRSNYDGDTASRSEDLSWASLGLGYQFSAKWHMSARYRYSNNDSSDPEFAYDRNLVTLGFQRQFGP